jgi:hypothetical protein
METMHSDKAPGPEGFIDAFFKKFWDIIKVDLMRVIHLFGTSTPKTSLVELRKYCPNA